MLKQSTSTDLMEHMCLVKEIIYGRFKSYIENFGEDLYHEGYLAMYEACVYMENDVNAEGFIELAQRRVYNALHTYIKKYAYKTTDSTDNIMYEESLSLQERRRLNKYEDFIMTQEIPVEPEEFEKLSGLGGLRIQF